jgi:hypothetical protein
MLGYKDANCLLGKNMHEVIHHSRADGSVYPVEECCIFQAFRLNSVMHVDDEVVWRSDRTYIPVEYWSHPVKHEGKIGGLHGDLCGYHGKKSDPGGAAPGA